MSLHSATICVLVVLSAFTSLSLVDGRSEATQNPYLMKLIWLPFGEKPPKHISSEALEGPLSQLPYINVSPSRAPKQLLGARYVSLRITTSTLTGLLPFALVIINIISFQLSVVTSISVLSPDDPESVRNKYERDYKKYAVESMQATVTQPKFKFYLYNEQGDLVQEELSIHDIQHFLLHQAYNVNSENNIFSKLNGSENVSLEEEVSDIDMSSEGKNKK